MSRIIVPQAKKLVLKTTRMQTLRENATLLQEIATLKKKLSDLQNKTKKSYPNVISRLSGGRHSVLPGNAHIPPAIKKLAENAIAYYQTKSSDQPYAGRVNEFGNYMETCMQDIGNIQVHKPTTEERKGQTSGYPDRLIKILDDGGNIVYTFYLEIKIYKAHSEDSAYRSFYLSTANKITCSCPHYLLGFEHIDKKLTGNFHIIDLYDKELTLKVEWAASNKTIYAK